MRRDKLEILFEDFLKKGLQPEISKDPEELFEELKAFAENYQGEEIPNNIRNILIIFTLSGAKTLLRNSMLDVLAMLSHSDDNLN